MRSLRFLVLRSNVKKSLRVPIPTSRAPMITDRARAEADGLRAAAGASLGAGGALEAASPAMTVAPISQPPVGGTSTLPICHVPSSAFRGAGGWPLPGDENRMRPPGVLMPSRESASARRISSAEAKRSAGFLAMAFLTMRSATRGMPSLGKRSDGAGGSSVMCLVMTPMGVPAENGGSPVSSLCITAPSA